mgnify:CR=1 FL=1
MIEEQFKNNGYAVINSDLKNNPKFLEICKNIYISLDKKLENTNIKKLRGYLMGNLNVYPGVFGDELLNLIKETKIIDLIEKIIDKNLNDMEINYGGNLSLQAT